jgi:hypothetical protein
MTGHLFVVLRLHLVGHRLHSEEGETVVCEWFEFKSLISNTMGSLNLSVYMMLFVSL